MGYSLDLKETAGHARQHVCVAGYRRPIFSPSFLSGVYGHTKDVPHQIDNLCRGALLLGATERKQIPGEMDLEKPRSLRALDNFECPWYKASELALVSDITSKSSFSRRGFERDLPLPRTNSL